MKIETFIAVFVNASFLLMVGGAGLVATNLFFP